MKTPSFMARSELRQTLWAFRRQFLVVGLLSAVANLLMLAPTLYMLQVYDRVLLSRNELTLLVVSLITLFLFGALGTSEWLRSRLLVRTGVVMDRLLGSRVFHAIFDANLSRTRDRNARALSDLLEIRQFITGNGVFAFFDTPWTPIYIAVLFLLHPVLGLVSIGFAVLQALLLWYSLRRTKKPAAQARESQQAATQFLTGKLRNLEAIEPMGLSAPLRQRWLQRHQQALADAESSQGASMSMAAVSKWLRYAQQSLSLGVGALLVIDGQLSAGAMIAGNVLMTRALAPIDQLVGTWRQFDGVRAAFGRLEELLAQHPAHLPSVPPAHPSGRMQLQQVRAEAAGRAEPILQDIDLDLQPGTVTVVMGPSGSGKSTLARVMLGIWPAAQGQVLVDGTPIGQWQREQLAPVFGYLPQDIELFRGTIAENIARLGKIDPEQVVKAAQAAGLHDMILRLPRGYDTPVGESGGLLSGGQRQRVALARAMYGSPPILVLDEPNANLDDVGEAALQQAVQHMKQSGQTVVIISHRPAALAVADQLVVLHGGRIAHAGPRDAVLQRLRQLAAAQGTPTATPTATTPTAA